MGFQFTNPPSIYNLLSITAVWCANRRQKSFNGSFCCHDNPTNKISRPYIFDIAPRSTALGRTPCATVSRRWVVSYKRYPIERAQTSTDAFRMLEASDGRTLKHSNTKLKMKMKVCIVPGTERGEIKRLRTANIERWAHWWLALSPSGGLTSRKWQRAPDSMVRTAFCLTDRI
jgi:hypothetical protein